MKGSRRRQSKRQREGERNRDGKIVQEGDREAKKVTHLYDSSEKWMETEIIPALPTEIYKGAQQAWRCGEKREIWAIGVALFTTEKMGRSCKHTHSSQEG